MLKTPHYIMLLVSILFVFSCSDKEALLSDESADLSFSYTLEGVVESGTKSRDVKNLVGLLTLYSHATETEETVDWYVAINEDLKTMTSTMEKVIPHGVYDFTLVVEDGAKKYIGSATNVDLTAGEEVALTVKPVIGSVSQVLIVDELHKLKLSYPVAELQNLADPKVEYTLDGTSSGLVSLSKTTGESDLYIDIPDGEHQLSLALLDGSMQVGRSRSEQETISSESFGNIVMDIVPLYSTVKTGTTIDGGEVTCTFNVPGELIEEVGGGSKLMTTFRLSSPKNGTIKAYPVLTFKGYDYEAQLTLPSCFYDTVAIDIEFKDNPQNEVIGRALCENLILNSNTSAINAPLTIHRRAIATGNILGVVNIAVFDATNAPVDGAKLYIDDTFVGLSQAAQNGFSTFQKSGAHTVRAEKDATIATSTVQVTPLGLHNVILNLQETPLSQLNMVWLENDGSDFEVMYWNGTEKVQLTDNTTDACSLKVSGTNATWIEKSSGAAAIYFWDGTTVQKISEDHDMIFSIGISGASVAWGAKVGSLSDIFLWSNGVATNISNSNDPDWLGGISDGKVLYNTNGKITLWENGVTTTVAEPAQMIRFLSYENGNVIWVTFGEKSDEVFTWDGTTIIQKTDNEDMETEVVSEGNTFAWTTVTNYKPNKLICFQGSTRYDLSHNPHGYINTITISNGSVYWLKSDSYDKDFALYGWKDNLHVNISNTDLCNGFYDVLGEKVVWTSETNKVLFWDGTETTALPVSGGEVVSPHVIQ